MEILNPLWLVILIPVMYVLFFHKNRYFVKLSSMKFYGIKKTLIDYMKYFGVLTCMFFVLAACDISYFGFISKVESPKRNYVLVNDASMSVVSGELLDTLIESNVSFFDILNKENRSDNIGCVLFSNDALVASFLIDDYDQIKHKILEDIEWDSPPLNSGTEVDKGLWCALMLLFNQYANFVDDLDIENIQKSISGKNDIKFNYKHIKNVDEIKHALRGSCIILFTDGYFFTDAMLPSGMSSTKIVKLCKQLGITVYVIDLIQPTPEMTKFQSEVRATGGDFIVVGTENIESAYKKIFSIESAPRKTISWSKRVISDYFGVCALLCLVVYFKSKRNITSV